MENHCMTKELAGRLGISARVFNLCAEAEAALLPLFERLDRIAEHNQYKTLLAMRRARLSEAHFSRATGYGYNDAGRDALEAVYADVFNTEDALVRPQIISGTHALALALAGNLNHGDELVSVSGAPYDTLQAVIGIRETKGSLIEKGVIYKQIPLAEDGRLDFEAIARAVTPRTKMVMLQRSRGYMWRRSFTVAEINELTDFVKNIGGNIICLIDNCYGEFADYDEPRGADMLVGSLIKNPGGGLAPCGGYIAGTRECVENAAIRLTAPGLGKEVGPSLGITASLAQGLFLAPTVVAGAVKSAALTAAVFERLGFPVLPSSGDPRSDIVQAVRLGTEERVLAFCAGIQAAAPVDSFAVPIGSEMPGYDCPVVMAAGAFNQGASIELSADAPLREPYIVYMQGGLTYPHGKIGCMMAAERVAGLSR